MSFIKRKQPALINNVLNMFKSVKMNNFKRETFNPDALNHPIAPSSSSLPLEAIDELLAQVEGLAVDVGSPYFMNQLFAGIRSEALKAEAVVAATRVTMATSEASRVFTDIEIELIRSLGALFGWDTAQTEGIAVPGGSAANFMAIHCARQAHNPESQRLGNSQHKYVIFVSRDSHYSWKKGAAALGLGTDAVLSVPTDSDGKMSISALETMIQEARETGQEPLLVAATAGTTVYGAFDPIDAIAKVCSKDNLWLHVDGAWGAPVVFSKNWQHLLTGIDQADSVTFDAHKLCGASLTSSFFLTNRAGILLESNDVSSGGYIFHGSDADTPDLGPRSWQCGRRADSFVFWTIWKRLGTEGLADLVDRLMSLRQEFVCWIRKIDRLELVHEPGYLNVCIKIIPPDAPTKIEAKQWSRHVRTELMNRDQAMVNFATADDGTTFIRMIIAHPDLQISHLKQIVSWCLEVK